MSLKRAGDNESNGNYIREEFLGGGFVLFAARFSSIKSRSSSSSSGGDGFG